MAANLRQGRPILTGYERFKAFFAMGFLRPHLHVEMYKQWETILTQVPRARFTMRCIPLHSLIPSPLNVRKTPAEGSAFQQLKTSIAAHGLLENLLVQPADQADDGAGRYEVVAGGRRLAALQALADEGGDGGAAGRGYRESGNRGAPAARRALGRDGACPARRTLLAVLRRRVRWIRGRAHGSAIRPAELGCCRCGIGRLGIRNDPRFPGRAPLADCIALWMRSGE